MPRARPKCYRTLALRPERDYTSAVMSLDRSTRVRPSALWWLATCFLIASQLFLTSAPLMEGRFGADARPHVEAAGTSVHHAHNAADCAACAARGLLATANHSTPPPIGSPQSVLPAFSERYEHLEFLKESNSRPRAPPLRQA